MKKEYSQDKVIRGLEITGAVAGVFLIIAAVLAFLMLDFTPHFMALAVGCGIVVNAVWMVLALVKDHLKSGAAAGAFTGLLVVIFIFQMIAL